MNKLVTLVLAATLLGGCVRHIYPQNKKIREYEVDVYAPQDAARTPGSMWSEASPGLFEDARARRIGDILTIVVDERADATRDTNTQTSRESSTTIGIPSFFAAMQALSAANPGLDPARLISLASEADFHGQGTTSRSGALNAVLPVRIRKVLPNGDFYVEGNKVLLLNEEESFLYISGVVRPIDIAPNNSVPSQVVADVELEYTGRGVLSERQSPGWLSRVLDYIWPF